MGNLRKKRILPDIQPAIILWGCFGGICLAVMVIFLQEIWAPVLDYNVSASRVKDLQVIGLSLILFWVFGMIASDLFCSGGEKGPGPVFTGLLSGITTAFVFHRLTFYYPGRFVFLGEWYHQCTDGYAFLQTDRMANPFFSIRNHVMHSPVAWCMVPSFPAGIKTRDS